MDVARILYEFRKDVIIGTAIKNIKNVYQDRALAIQLHLRNDLRYLDYENSGDFHR